jgi:hypothetical protein
MTIFLKTTWCRAGPKNQDTWSNLTIEHVNIMKGSYYMSHYTAMP